MKKHLLVLAIAFLLIGSNLKAAEHRTFGIFGSIGAFIGSGAALGYGGGIHLRMADSFGLGIEYFGTAAGGLTGGLIPLDFKFYMGDGNFYLAPNIGLFLLTASSGTTLVAGGLIEIGMAAGYELELIKSAGFNFGLVPEARLSLIAIQAAMFDVALKARFTF